MTVSAMENQIKKNNIAATGFVTMQLSHRSYRSVSAHVLIFDVENVLQYKDI